MSAYLVMYVSGRWGSQYVGEVAPTWLRDIYTLTKAFPLCRIDNKIYLFGGMDESW